VFGGKLFTLVLVYSPRRVSNARPRIEALRHHLSWHLAIDKRWP